MYRKIFAGFCIFLAGEIALNVLGLIFAAGETGPRLFPWIAAEFGYLGAAAVVFLVGYARLSQRYSRVSAKHGELVSIISKVLDSVFAYFDGSFIVIHSLFALANGRPESLETAEAELTALYKEKAVDKYLEQKGERLSLATKAWDEKSLTYVDELIGHAENMASMLGSAKALLPRDAFARLDLHKKNLNYNTLLSKLVVSYDFYAKLIHEFFGAIIIDLSRSSRPLSEEILTIKENANHFIETITLWEKEFTDESSPRNFNALMSNYNRQNGDFGRLSHAINSSYESLDKKLASILSVVDEMAKQSAQIQAIAEKIKVLSINASIEAARATAEGKGFKVIANEVKNLSGMTHGIIDGIIKSMASAQEQVLATVKGFGEEGRKLAEQIKGQQGEFTVFYSILSDYAENFKSIFTSVAKLIGDIDVHIKSLNPLFQLHEISIQEMENLNKIISEFLFGQRDEMNPVIEGVKQGQQKEYLVSVIREYEKKMISQFEIDVLGKIIDHYGLTAELGLQKETKGIEIF